MSNLLKLQKKLTRRQNHPKTGDKGKLTKVSGLLSLIKNDTNVENENNNAPPPSLDDETLPVNTLEERRSVYPVNIIQEMMEGENAVEAVRNLEQSMVHDNTWNNSPVHVVNTGKQTAVNQSMPIISPNEESDVAAVAAWSEPLHRGAPTDEEKEPILETNRDCAELFDPCTREPIENSDISILEKRVREIKKIRLQDISGQHAFPDTITNRLELLLFILNRKDKPDEQLLQYDNSGHLYESYWDIVFALGLMDSFPITDDFYMFNGKIETLTNIDGDGFMNSPFTYLSSKKVNEGNKSGASDITFVYKHNKVNVNTDTCSSDPNKSSYHVPSNESKDKETPQFFFCSVKYFANDKSKGVDKLDIQNIYTAAKALHQEYDRKIILLVKNKGAVEEKLRKALRRYISDEARYVYGMDDLFAALTRLYDFIHNRHSSEEKITIHMLNRILMLESPPKPILRLRLHQYLAVYKICDAIKDFAKTRVSNKFLVGIVPRGGKTFIAGGIIDRLQPRRVVVLLGAKSETLSQFKADLFEEFQNFQDYECIDVLHTTTMTIVPSKKYIFIMSVELYKQADSSRQLLQELKGGSNHADLFICDEAHLKQTTARAVKQMDKGTLSVKEEVKEEEDISEKAEEAELKELDKQIQSDIPVVYMTGTYIKPLKAFKIPDKNVVIWDYQDIQQAKELSTNEEYFKENFGELYDRALDTCISYGQTRETIQQQYQKFPELYLLTTQFTPDAKDAFLKQSSGGFPTLSHLFEVRVDFNPETTPPERWYTGFTNPKGMMRLLNYLAPPTQHVGGVDGVAVDPISSVLKSVDNIAQRIGDRLGFFTSEFVTHSQLWFLPHMQKNPLYKRMCALAGAIFQSSWFRKYFHVIGVSSSVPWNIPSSNNKSIEVKAADGTSGTFSWACPTGEKSLKQCLIDQEAVARRNGKGLIILAQNMLHLGISLPCVDIVVLLDTGEKVDERIQKMYRALTESTNKKGAYIIDMNYFRTVTAMMNYQIEAEQSRKGKKQIYTYDIPKLFNKVLDTFSIDDDKPILRTDIEKETIPELQKLLLGDGKKVGDSIMLEDAGVAMNANIKQVLEKGYMHSYDAFLEALKEEEQLQNKMRNAGKGVKKAEHNGEEHKQSNSHRPPPIINPILSEKEKRIAYIDVFKTTLKLGAFGTDSMDIAALYDALGSDRELREVIYDTLIKRGTIKEDASIREEQKDYIIDIMIRPGLSRLISEGKNASYKKMKEYIEDKEKYPVHVEEVLDYIKEHLTPKSAERHKYGEVFTPMSLVNEMLDTLPSEVWKDKTLTWLDPANGMGNFPIGVFLRLFYGFRTKAGKYVGITNEGADEAGVEYNPGLTKILDDDVRRKHIVKDMLFMVELNSKNNTIAKNLFKKLAPGVEPNIIQMHRTNGFLEDVEMKFPNGTVNTFDIVMGNPPFQGGAVRGKSTDKTRKMRIEENVGQDKHKNLWIPFVKKVLAKHMKKNGYLLFIHPIGWFKPDRTGIHEEMLQYQIKDMRIYDMYQSMKVFSGKGKISVAYYLLENKPVYTTTTIVDRVGKKEIVQLNSKSIIILAINSIFSKIQKKASLFYDDDQLRVTSIPSAKCSAGSNKQIHRISETGEITYCKTSVKHKDQHSPKLYLSGYQNPRFYHDKDGIYGLIGSHQHYFIGSDLDKLEDYFKTKLSAILLKHAKYDQEFIEPKYYPDVRTLPLKKITDDTLADYFGFTKEERAAIDATEYPARNYTFKEISCAELKNEKSQEGGKLYNRFQKTRKQRKN
jgi:superfamily II DNA or RNA helicase